MPVILVPILWAGGAVSIEFAASHNSVPIGRMRTLVLNGSAANDPKATSGLGGYNVLLQSP